MAQPPRGLGRRLRLPEKLQGASIKGGQPARHHPLGVRRFQGRAGCQALSLRPPSLPAPALGQLELAQRKLSLGGVSLVRLHPGNSFGLRGHRGHTALRLRDRLDPEGRVRKEGGGQGVLRRKRLKRGGTPRRHTVRRQKEKRLRGGGGKVRGGKSSEATPETTLKGGPEVEAGSRISPVRCPLQGSQKRTAPVPAPEAAPPPSTQTLSPAQGGREAGLQVWKAAPPGFARSQCHCGQPPAPWPAGPGRWASWPHRKQAFL
jgi:hypothetical protein